MHRCPKCSGWMSGPRYRRLGWGGEVLIYTCHCGYVEQHPTHDAPADEPFAAAAMTDDQALVEKVARAMTAARGFNPDELVPRSGYSQDRNNLIPKWHFDVEFALRHIAATNALGPGNGEISPGTQKEG